MGIKIRLHFWIVQNYWEVEVVTQWEVKIGWCFVLNIDDVVETLSLSHTHTHNTHMKIRVYFWNVLLEYCTKQCGNGSCCIQWEVSRFVLNIDDVVETLSLSQHTQMKIVVYFWNVQNYVKVEVVMETLSHTHTQKKYIIEFIEHHQDLWKDHCFFQNGV